MKRFFIFLGVLLFLVALSQTRAGAVSEEEIYKESGAASLEGAPESLSGSLSGGLSESFSGSLSGNASKNASENASEGAHGSAAKSGRRSLYKSLCDTLKNALALGAPQTLKYGSAIAGALLLLSLAGGLRGVRPEDDTGCCAFEFVGAAVLAAVCFPALYSAFSYARAAVDGLCTFSASLLPVSASLYTMGGNCAEAVAASSGLSLFLTAAEIFNARLLLPFLSVGTALALTGLLPGSEHIAPAASVVKRWVCALIAFVFSLVSFVFYFQTAVAAAADNVGCRAVKFASGAFIPVIGSAVGDSARTVFGAVSSVKAAVGVSGLCVMLGYVLPPLVSTLLCRAMFSFCSLFARLCGLEKQSRFIGELSAVLGAALALLISCAVVFTVISAVFLKSGVSV